MAKATSASLSIFPTVGSSICKYGLTQQVSQPGTYGNFKFEILLECDKESLTENEYAKIEELQPEYNRMMCPPSPDRMWPRKEY